MKLSTYSRLAVNNAIASSRQKIGAKEAAAIHRILQGRSFLSSPRLAVLKKDS